MMPPLPSRYGPAARDRERFPGRFGGGGGGGGGGGNGGGGGGGDGLAKLRRSVVASQVQGTSGVAVADLERIRATAHRAAPREEGFMASL